MSLSTFRDELTNLFPNNALAARLSKQSFLLSEFLEASEYSPPTISGEAIVHMHCHHRAVIGVDAERALLAKTGMKVKILDSGCCGMAGSYGFAPEHYENSISIGEKVLLPAVRQANPETRILVNGFSCREQISHGTKRRTMHLAELLSEAIAAEAISKKK